jgi:small subunit ribosomal protein S3
MGQKGHPKGFRLQLDKDWDSSWYSDKRTYGKKLVEDEKIRRFLETKLRFASVSKIKIERAGNNKMRVKIFTGRPGIVIGRKGQELEKLKESVQKLTNSEILLDIQEVDKPDVVAQLVAENVALQLERRISFRRAMKKAVQMAMSLGVEGIKVQCSGRLAGADIARTESQRAGSVPLQTLRKPINFGFKEASTVYGIIGVKCWICDREKTTTK